MQEIQFDYFRGMEAEQYSFYRVPKVLFTAECFKSLSCEAKVLYGLMLDRMSLSIKNRWFDEEDRVYIIFTVEEIAELLNCGTQKAVKLMKELDDNQGIGLIEKKRLGLGKPNVIYVKNFILKEKCSPEQRGKAPENLGNTQNSENHNSRIVKTTNQELPESQFKNDENHNSEVVKNNILEFSKSQSNKTNINKTDNNQSILSKNVDLSEDELDKINHCRKIVKEQISYTAFEQNKFYRIELVDELVELMTEIFMMPDEAFERVNGTEKSIAVIKSRFCKINQLHIEYVLDSMQKNQTNIGNIKAYLLTALYNSTITMDSYYQARVNYDLRENF